MSDSRLGLFDLTTCLHIDGHAASIGGGREREAVAPPVGGKETERAATDLWRRQGTLRTRRRQSLAPSKGRIGCFDVILHQNHVSGKIGKC